jgi:hypothetical protein
MIYRLRLAWPQMQKGAKAKSTQLLFLSWKEVGTRVSLVTMSCLSWRTVGSTSLFIKDSLKKDEWGIGFDSLDWWAACENDAVAAGCLCLRV